MTFKVLFVGDDGKTVYARIDDDGVCRLTCTEEYPEFQTWVAAGNTPEPMDEEQ